MLSTFIIVFAFMLCFILVMAVGVLFGQKPISGSCGGMAAIGMESECDVCGGDKSKCDKEESAGASAPLEQFYDATMNK